MLNKCGVHDGELFVERLMSVQMFSWELSAFSVVETRPQIQTFLKHGFYHSGYVSRQKRGNVHKAEATWLFVSVLNISVLQILLWIQPRSNTTLSRSNTTLSRNYVGISQRGISYAHKYTNLQYTLRSNSSIYFENRGNKHR